MTMSAHGVLTVFGDNFESGSPPAEDNNPGGFGGFSAGLPGWDLSGSSAGFHGRFNADDDTGIEWYHGIAGFEDDTGGEVGDMDGPTKGTIFAGLNANGGGDVIQILIGVVEPDTLYEAVIALSGGRTAPADLPLGYTIDLMAGSTVISSSGTAAEAAALLFDDVSVALDSSANPSAVGENLFFRITTVGTTLDSGKNYYIDFDNARFTETVIPEPSLSLLLALTGLTLLLRRKRD